MLTEFGKIFVFLLVAILFVVVAVLFAKLIRPARPTKEKLLTYECGENVEGSPWVQFDIRFYVVALIFLIFDVEIVLLVPWALVFKNYGWAGFVVGFIFLFLLALGMAYEWVKGDLEWARPKPVPPKLKKEKLDSSNQLETKEILIEQ